MKKLFKRLFLKRREEADLNKDSINAAMFYLKKMGSGMPMKEQSDATNYFAHGFYCGWRKAEEELGARNGK